MIKSKSIASTICYLFTRWCIKHVEGLEYLPRTPQPVIFAPNHSSLLDGVVMGVSITWRRFYLAHSLVVAEPFKHWLFGWILRSTQAIELDRANRASITRALQLALGYLQRGRPITIFPEGHLNNGKTLRLPRAGLALLALNSGAPIIPCGIRGTRAIAMPDEKIRLKRCVSVHFGAPIPTADLAAQYRGAPSATRRELLAHLSQSVMTEIATLSGLSVHRRSKL